MSTAPPPLENTNEEQALVERAKAGDAQAFSRLVDKYERKIFRLAKHITQNDEDAEDVLQESFPEGVLEPRQLSDAVEVLYVAGPDCGQRGADEAAQAEIGPHGFSG